MAIKGSISWGLLGCGRIANKFATSMSAAKGAIIIAVASRTAGKAREFARKYGISAHYDKYEDLVVRDDIDAVYIATTHNFHYENIKLALENGKHVLCEKPLTVNGREAREVIDLSRRKRLFLMEGMWTRFLPAIVRLRELLCDGAIGEIRQVRADLGFRNEFNTESRLLKRDLAGGALLDVGVYPLSFSSMVMGERPKEIKAVGDIGSTGVDEQSAYLLAYDDGRISMLSSAIRTALNNHAEVIGTEGRIVIPPVFFKGKSVELQKNGEEPLVFEHSFVDQEGFRFEIEEASNTIHSGKTESSTMPLDETLAQMETIDEIKRQLGLVFPNDR